MSFSRNPRLNRVSTFLYHQTISLDSEESCNWQMMLGMLPQPGVDGMDVSGVNSTFRVLKSADVSRSSSTDNRSPAVSPTQADELHISTAGRMLDQLNQTPEIREQRLSAIREMIANGTYDTEAKFEAAVEEMMRGWRDESLPNSR